MKNRTSLSVCLIVKNEEVMLPACLESLRNVADEIIVGDTGSTDRTKEIARSFGAKVIDIIWNNNFAEARNQVIEQAKGNWILSIDADERLQNPEELIWVISHAKPEHSAFMVNCISLTAQNSLLDTESTHPTTTYKSSSVSVSHAKYVSQVIRLFRNSGDIQFRGAIHEQVTESLIEGNHTFIPSEIDILHLGYNLSAEQMHIKQLRNLSLLNSALEATPDDAYLVFQRAKTHLAIGNLSSAESDILHCLQFATQSGTVRPQALNYGALIAFRSGDISLAISRANESLECVKGQVFSWYILGECYTSRMDFDAALNAYLEVHSAMEADDIKARIVGAYQLPEEHLAFLIGRSYLALGDNENADRYFRAGLYLQPNDVSCKIGLANVAMNRQEFAIAEILLQEAHRLGTDVTHLRTILHNRKNGFSTTVSSSDEVSDKTTTEIDTTTTLTDKYEQPLLSLCMIVKNEERVLRTCLKSVRGIVDEIVIVDTGSSDTTMSIAREFGAKEHNFQWTGDFAEARNHALQYCTGKWILYLDADEYLTDKSRQELRTFISALPEKVGGAICTIISPHRNNDTTSEVHRGGYPRLFRNYGFPKIQFRGRVHEQITPSILECGGSIVQSSLEIYHTGYDIERDDMEKKVRRNYELLIKHVQDEPLNAYAWFQLGQTLGRMEMAEKSEEALKFALELGSLSTPISASAASTLAHLCGSNKRYEEALYWAEYSLNKVPEQLLAMNYKAHALLYLGRYDESEECFRNVLAIINGKDSSSPSAGYDVELKPELVYEGLKRIEQLRKQSNVGAKPELIQQTQRHKTLHTSQTNHSRNSIPETEQNNHNPHSLGSLFK
jgi:glycosyltransferase involved in cell wall biosynthesis